MGKEESQDGDKQGGNKTARPVWNLDRIFPGSAFEDILKDIDKEAERFSHRFKGRVVKLFGYDLGLALDDLERISAKAGLVLGALRMLGENEAARARVMRALSKTAFFARDVNKIKETDLLDKIAAPALARHAPWIRAVRSYRPHQLDDAVEEYLDEKRPAAEEAWRRLYDMTHIGLQDPAAEKGAFALILNTLADLKRNEDALRGFENPEDAAHLAHQTDSAAIDIMMRALKESHRSTSHRYHARKASGAVAPPGAAALPWEKARDAVLAVFGAFSPEFGDIARAFFDEGRVRSGPAGFHPLTPLVKPHVRVPYAGAAQDILALSRALGMGVHQTLANAQGHFKSRLPPVLARASGLFAELLIAQELAAREDDLFQKRALLEAGIESMIEMTVVPGALFAFEKKFHAARRAKGELDPERFSRLWRETQEEALGSPVAEHLWASTPALAHRPFASAAEACAGVIAQALLIAYNECADKKVFVAQYRDLLADGCGQNLEAALAPFRFDLHDPAFWKKGLSLTERRIEALEELDRKIEAILAAKSEFKTAANDLIAPKGENLIAPRDANDTLSPPKFSSGGPSA